MGESFDKTYPFFGFLLGFVEFLVLFPKGIHIFGLLNENNFVHVYIRTFTKYAKYSIHLTVRQCMNHESINRR